MPRGNWTPETREGWRGREQARKLLPTLGPCEACGAVANDRHHRNGQPTDNRLENIAQLCRRCHMRADGRLIQIAAYDAARKPQPPRICMACGKAHKPSRRGLCNACDKRRRKGEPCASHTERTLGET